MWWWWWWSKRREEERESSYDGVSHRNGLGHANRLNGGDKVPNRE
jgi:hypothetical protein